MTEAVFRDDVLVQLRKHMGDEDDIVEVARVSTEGADSRSTESSTGLVKYLVREGHGVPLEAVIFRFYVEAPVFVTRQMLKHRIASINEESGRYKELEGVFYFPNQNRKIVQVGKTGNYEFEEGRPDQWEAFEFVTKSMGKAAWDNYTKLLEVGIAKEMARINLPFNIYSALYITINLRSLLNFIAKRKEWENAGVVSHAQKEIDMVTTQMVEYVKEIVPNVWESFEKNGYRPV